VPDTTQAAGVQGQCPAADFPPGLCLFRPFHAQYGSPVRVQPDQGAAVGVQFVIQPLAQFTG
jgi:hypothetical protein